MFNPSLQRAYCKDVRRVHMGTAPTIATVREAYGANIAEAWLEVQLNNLSEFAGCKDKLNREQREETAQMIIETYGYYKVTEFMLFFHRFKRCDYGKFYGAVDPMVIMAAMKDFAEERLTAIKRYEREIEREQQAQTDAIYEQIKQRYAQRIPNAGTDRAAINLWQYRLMGFDYMTDEELGTALNEIQTGRRILPKNISELFNSQQ